MSVKMQIVNAACVVTNYRSGRIGSVFFRLENPARMEQYDHRMGIVESQHKTVIEYLKKDPKRAETLFRLVDLAEGARGPEERKEHLSAANMEFLRLANLAKLAGDGARLPVQ
ncbi:MAG: hypothetical protein WC588_02965 [Candidatus Micrarchaeia archaeon]